MNEKTFLENMADILDSDEQLNLSTELADLEEWNSLAVLSFMADMEKHAVSKLSPQSVRDAKTLADLYGMIKH